MIGVVLVSHGPLADGLRQAAEMIMGPQEALAVLEEGSPETPAATDLMGQVAQALAALAKIDSAQNEMANQAEVLLDGMSDLIHSLRDYLEEIEFNPKRLDEVEERLDLLEAAMALWTPLARARSANSRASSFNSPR